ncbi:hypothetical protein DBR42_25670 [Pelomonas sp. HMWF004]|nr:hypothetical protein DBR42_25670 [Pelomonas sp. HMWF004]
MIAAATGALLSVLLSTGWRSDLHFMDNLLSVMSIQVLGDEYGIGALLQFPTKYALAVFVVLFAVGLAVRLTTSDAPLVNEHDRKP